MQSKATTVERYLASLPEDRRHAIETVREVILENLDGYEEGMQYGMIGYYVPRSLYPAGYHCDPSQPLCFAGLASQKNHMSLYLMCLYGATDYLKWFRHEWAKSGKRLDMGKACIRFRKLDDLALDVIGEAVKRVPAKKYIEHCERALQARKARPAKGHGKTRGAAKPAKGKKRAARTRRR